MKTFPLLIPLLLLGGFLVLHHDAGKVIASREAAHAAELRLATVRAAMEKERLAGLAANDAIRRVQERERLERERLEKREQEQTAQLQALAARAAERRAAVDALAHEVAALARRLEGAKTRRQDVDRELFETSRRVELQRVERRNAELEVERASHLVAARLHAGSWFDGETPAGR